MKATIVANAPLDNTVAFKDMLAGEFLSSDAGNIGVKTTEGDILWVAGPTTRVGIKTYAYDISYGKRYKQPVSVVVTV